MSAPPKPPPKTMSSRLLTMKFMQRGATSSPITESIPHHPSKRQRLSSGKGSATTTSPADSRAIQAAIAAEEAKRQAALDRQALEAGETKWVLSVREESGKDVNGVLKVMKMEEEDVVLREGEDEDAVKVPWSDGGLGRRSFGMFNKALEKGQAGLRSSSDHDLDRDLDQDLDQDSDHDSDHSTSDLSGNSDKDSSDDDSSGISALIYEEEVEAARQAREGKAQRRSAAEDSVRLGGRRNKEKEEVDLDNLVSISGRTVIDDSLRRRKKPYRRRTKERNSGENLKMWNGDK